MKNINEKFNPYILSWCGLWIVVRAFTNQVGMPLPCIFVLSTTIYHYKNLNAVAVAICHLFVCIQFMTNNNLLRELSLTHTQRKSKLLQDATEEIDKWIPTFLNTRRANLLYTRLEYKQTDDKEKGKAIPALMLNTTAMINSITHCSKFYLSCISNSKIWRKWGSQISEEWNL